MKFAQEKEELPQIARLGISSRFLDRSMLVALDYSLPSDNNGTLHGGLEYKLAQRTFLRGGYQITPGNNLGGVGITGITGGLGFQMGRVVLDYAISPFGDLGTTHKFSFLFRFNQN